MIYYFTRCKPWKVLALFKSLVFPGDASIACVIKEDGLDISTDKFQHKNIKTLRSSYSYAYIYITAFFTSLCIKLVMLMLILSNPVLRTPAQYGETPRYYGPYSLSLVKVSPHIFSKFNPLYTDTFFGPLRELKQRRRRRQRERQKSNRFRLAKRQLCACITFFLYIS